MIIKEIEFIGSFERLSQCPTTQLPEYAFIGRSNVGKSSLINAITGRKELARISSTPGKTQTMNYYLINNAWYLVDLPGYGYAKSSKTNRAKWRKMIDFYLKKRDSLYCVFCLIDIRHDLQKLDLDFVNWLGENAIPFSLTFTKSDKLKPNMVDIHVNKIIEALKEYWVSLPEYFVTSANTPLGTTDILSFIEKINNN